MSIFASETSETIAIPFDTPHTATIRKVPARILRLAQEESKRDAREFLQRMGGDAFTEQLKASVGGTPEAVAAAIEEARKDPLIGYHRETLVRHGVTGWTYKKQITDAVVADLEDDALEFFARAVLRLSKPSLFEDAEAARKNG